MVRVSWGLRKTDWLELRSGRVGAFEPERLPSFERFTKNDIFIVIDT